MGHTLLDTISALTGILNDLISAVAAFAMAVIAGSAYSQWKDQKQHELEQKTFEDVSVRYHYISKQLKGLTTHLPLLDYNHSLDSTLSELTSSAHSKFIVIDDELNLLLSRAARHTSENRWSCDVHNLLDEIRECFDILSLVSDCLDKTRSTNIGGLILKLHAQSTVESETISTALKSKLQTLLNEYDSLSNMSPSDKEDKDEMNEAYIDLYMNLLLHLGEKVKTLRTELEKDSNLAQECLSKMYK